MKLPYIDNFDYCKDIKLKNLQEVYIAQLPVVWRKEMYRECYVK